jgi:ligand-binding sensor domain-containing protein
MRLIPFLLRRYVILFVIQFFVLLSYAQEYYNFIHYPPESGIISNQVNTTVQDDEGYLWLGTTNGLQRFDGVRFKTYRHHEKDPLSLPVNTVWQLLVDKQKNLWLLLSDGSVGIFDRHNFTFKQAAVKFREAASPNTLLKKLITDEEGNIFYLISGSEVITFNKDANSFSYTYNFFQAKDEWKIVDFAQQPGTHKYWMAIEKGGIAIFDKSTSTLSYAGNNAGKEPAVDVFDKTKSYHTLFFDTKNRLWSVNQNNPETINCYNFLIDEFTEANLSLSPEVKPGFSIKNFMQQKDGTIWMNGMFLLARFSEGDRRFQPVQNGYENERTIAYEMVHCLYEDRENNIWVCTDNNGLYRFNPSQEFFTNIDHRNRQTGERGKGNVLSFMRTQWGSLLVGTSVDGLYNYDRTFNTTPLNVKGIDNKSGPVVWSMAASKDSNTIWMGSGPGLYALDQAKRTSKFFNPAILENSSIRQVVEDKSGNLWLGTQSKGIFKCTISRQNGISIETITAVSAVPAVQINKLTIDTKGLIWVATPENGLYVLDAETNSLQMHFGDQELNERKLPERGISGVLQYSDTIMLISTATRLLKYNTLAKEIKQVDKAGFISGFITAMEKDDSGYLWLTSTSGLYRIDIYRRIFILYNRTDGLDNEHFIQSSSYTLPDGKIFFGATNNYVLFNPRRMKGFASNAVVKITDIKVQNKPLKIDSVMSLKELKLGYDDNPLVIEFSPFMFTGINIVKYKMEGLDKDWNLADRTNQAIYSYLPPGSYSFMIKQADDTGNNATETLLLKIEVKSPFWRTGWFYSLLVLLGFAVLYLLDRERLAKKAALQKMRSEIADDLHQEVNTALNNINILSEMARIKADTEPQKSKEFIEQIHTKSHNMIIAMDDMLWSISPENDSMEKTILRLKEYIEALKNRHGVQIDLLVDEKVKMLQLNMKQRKDVFWFFKGGITTVTRSGGKNSLIHITYEKSNIVYTLEFDTTQADIVQLNNLRQRQELAQKIAAANAKLEVKELKTKTIFLLTIPVHK